ncbi:unnamed protein product [Closterium sp. NIES-53]
MEVARTSMIRAVAPHFLWPIAVRNAAHQLKFWPRVSLRKTSPTLRWTGKVGDASVFRFYHPTLRRVLPSQDVTFDESVPFYRLFPYRTAPLPPPAALPCSRSPSGRPPPPSGSCFLKCVSDRPTSWDCACHARCRLRCYLRCSTGGSAFGGAASGGAEPAPAEPGGAEPAGAESRGTEPEGSKPKGAESEGAESGGAQPGGAEPRGTEPEGVEPKGAGSEGAESEGAEPRGAGGSATRSAGAGGTAATRLGGAGVTAGAGNIGGAGDAGPGGARTRDSPLLAPSPCDKQADLFNKRREPDSHPALSVCAVCTGHRIPGPRLAPVPGTHIMALRPSSVPIRVPLPPPPRSSLPTGPDPKSDLAHATSPTVPRLLATVVIGPLFESTAAFAELDDFAATCRLAYAASLVAESESDCPPSVGGEYALGTDVLEDMQEEFECLAATVPHLVAMLLAHEEDPDAPDIPTPRSYAEAITRPYSSQWQTAMDAELASWKSTGTYVDAVPPLGANIVDGMWIFRVKRPPGSPPVFKARYVARGFSQRQVVDFLWTFSLTPKMTTLRVLLHVAAHCDYELHLRRPVYGLRQAPREWLDTLKSTLAALGFAPSTSVPSLFLRTNTSLLTFYILVYVDDLVFATADTEALALVKSELQKRHTCTDLGELRSYLGLQITRDRARRTITLTQSHMVHQVLQRFSFCTSGMGLVHGGRGPVVLAGHADASCQRELCVGPRPRLGGADFEAGSRTVPNVRVGDTKVMDTLEGRLEDARRRHEAQEYGVIPWAVIEAGLRSVWAAEHPPSRPASPRPVTDEGGVDVGVNAGGDHVGSSAGGMSMQRGVIHADEVDGVQTRGMRSTAAAGTSQGDVRGRRSGLSPMSATQVTAGGIAPSYGYFKFTPDRILVTPPLVGQPDILTWKEAIEPQLEMAGLIGFARGTVATPEEHHADLRAEFRAVQLLTFTVISRCCSPVTDDLFIAQLEGQLTHLRMGDEEMATDYCNRARRILTTIRMAGAQYSTASYVTHVMQGLSSSYNLLKRLSMALRTRTTLNEDNLTSYILQDEATQEAERSQELLAQANFIAPAKQGGRPGQRGQSGGGGSSGWNSTKEVDKKKPTKDSGRGGGGRRRECWLCGDPDHLSFECPDRSDPNDDDTKGGRGRSGSRRPRRGGNQPRKEKQSTTSTSAKDADYSAGGKVRDDKAASCSLVGVVESTVSLAPEAGEDFQAVAAAVQANPAVVLLDSGCSHHLMGTKEVFVDLQPSGPIKHVRGFNGALQDVQGRGTVTLQGEAGKQVLIPDVLYVPGVRANLLSSGQLKELGVKLQEDGDGMLLVSAAGEVLGRATYIGRVLCTNLRPCSMKPTSPTPEVVALREMKSTPDRMHARLAHVGMDTIRSSAKNEVAIGLDLKLATGADSPSVSCVGGKLAQHTFPNQGSDADDVLAVMHIDLSGPFRVAAKDGSLYFLLLKDRKTRFV